MPGEETGQAQRQHTSVAGPAGYDGSNPAVALDLLAVWCCRPRWLPMAAISRGAKGDPAPAHPFAIASITLLSSLLIDFARFAFSKLTL